MARGEQLRIVADDRNQLLLSAASSWEIVVKYQLGKLPLPESPERLHRDPFDRLLVAQAKLLDLTIVTTDSAVAQYPVATLMV